ncbi:MAG: CoA-disulfide reductase [Syntrophomonadaceae bacterium]|nr:CoA-disulfide reductase [Syntrophomonadaceae bacterium]MDD4561800.1 CoA-disulfide reductase [Syntrophomonadaceae bacterium]
MSEKLVIIGGVAAGTSAAAKARRVNPDLDITVYTDDEYISYAGCGLPYFIGGKIASRENLLARSVADFAAQNISVKTLMRVEEIKPENGKVIIRNLQNQLTFEDNYDRLVIATGARPFVPPLERVELDGIFTLRTIHDSLKIKEYLFQHRPQKAAVIGAGYIGLEMVENLVEHGCQVTLIEKAPHIIPNMDADMAQILTQYLQSRGVEIRTGETITGFMGNKSVSGLSTDKGEIAADFVLLSIGVQPNSEIAAAAGIEPGINNAIRVNSKMETNKDRIYAAGDCATTSHLISGKEVYIPMGTTANKQGRVAGENAAGGNASFSGVLSTGIARVMEMEISRTGLCESECQALGINYISRRIKSRTAAHYCPVSGEIHLKLIVNQSNNRLIGAQIVGFAGAAMRIDMLATAITVGTTVEDLIDMDLAYSPPFSPVWDPVLIALNQF